MSTPELPTVLVLRPPSSFNHFHSEFSKDFHFIKAYQSDLPLRDFLSSTPSASSATALLSSPIGPTINPDLLRILPHLRCIVTTSVGVNHIDLAECRRRRIAVASAGDIFSDDTADTAVSLLIDVLRKVSFADRYVRRGSWILHGDVPLGTALRGKRVGIVGLGRTGSKIARRLAAFGCEILYTSRNQKPLVPYAFYPNVLELAAQSNILLISCALNEETKHAVNKEVLTALGKDGVIVNIARGPIIVQEELIRSLAEGRIAGAAMDVFEDEPFVPKELWEMDNVVLTPHMAVNTMESYRGIYECVTANLKAFFSDQSLLTPVLDN